MCFGVVGASEVFEKATGQDGVREAGYRTGVRGVRDSGADSTVVQERRNNYEERVLQSGERVKVFS